MKRKLGLERVSRWLVVFAAWSWAVVSFLYQGDSHWSVFHLLTLTFLLLMTEFFPLPGHEGRVTVHFPFLFAISTMYSTGVAGIVYTVIVLSVTWILKHSLIRAAFRTGYTILGLVAVQLFLDGIGNGWMNLGGLAGPTLTVAVSIFLYEGVSKGIRDGIEYLRPRPRKALLWINNWRLELGSALLSFLYCLAYFVVLHQGRDTDSWIFLFFFTPLAAFAVLSHVIARLIRKERKLKLLFLLATHINKDLNLKKVLKQTLHPLSKVIHYHYGIGYLLRDGRLYPAVAAGDVPEALKRQSQPLNRGLNGWVASHGLPALVHHAHTDPRCQSDLEDNEEIRSLLAVPLEMDGEVLGVITLGKNEERGFEEVDLHFLQVLASQTVVAIKNARLIEERERRLVAEERNRLAREIHDGIAQSFAGVLMKLESSRKAFDTQPEQVKAWLEESEEKLRHGLKEVRHSITTLRPSPAAQIGLIPALTRRVEALEHEANVKGSFVCEGEQVPLDAEVGEAIYMVCHEALSNAAKHAQASRVDVTLTYDVDEVRLTVEDDGVGFSLANAVYKAEAQKRYGIVGMNERAQQLGAALHFDSEEGKGTRIVLTIPTGKEEEAAVHAHTSAFGG
jgi:signal transduction histidine kinase